MSRESRRDAMTRYFSAPCNVDTTFIAVLFRTSLVPLLTSKAIFHLLAF